MEQNINHKTELKENFINFYKANKLRLYAFVSILVLILGLLILLDRNNKNKNLIIAEKYIEAGIYLSSGKIEKSKNLYTEIILEKNKFYSILALNTILEKELVTDKNEILNYFNIVEKTNRDKDQTDIINFKKGLYLIKNSDTQKGNQILKTLIDNNSKLKSLVEDIIIK
jgi:hypothetical protein